MGTLARLGRLAPLLLIAAAEAPAADRDTGAPDNRRHIHQRLRDRDDRAARELIERHLQRFPTDAVMLYNAACVECRLDAPQRAAGYLIRAVKAGFADFSHLRRDPDLRPLRSHPIYRAIIAAVRVSDETLTQEYRPWMFSLGPGLDLVCN